MYYPSPFSKITLNDESAELTLVFEILGLDEQAEKSVLILIDHVPIPLTVTYSVHSIDIVELGPIGEHELIIYVLDDQEENVKPAKLRFSVEFESKSKPLAELKEIHSALSAEANMRSMATEMLLNSYFPYAFSDGHMPADSKHLSGIVDNKVLGDSADFMDLLFCSERYKNKSAVQSAALDAASKGDLNAMFIHAFWNTSNLCPSNMDSFRKCAEGGNALCHMALGFRYWYGLHATKESCGRALQHYMAAGSTAMNLNYPVAGAIPQSMVRIAEDNEVILVSTL